MIQFRSPTLEDCTRLVAQMRPADRQEVLTVRGKLRANDIWSAIAHEGEATAAYRGDDLVCIFGVWDGPDPRMGIPWMLGTELLDHHALSLCRLVRPTVARWLGHYEVLSNCTDRRNVRVLDWLRWLGFQFIRDVEVNGVPFIQFAKVRHVSGNGVAPSEPRSGA